MIKFDYPYGSSPINPDDAKGLLLPHITNKTELDRWEQDNINEAEMWAFNYKKKDIITISFILRLHKKMLENVWSWAGEFRKSDTNIGIEWYKITENLKILCEDTNYWIEHSTFEPDEIAMRFHYRLVAIHPFPNGNGRHSRLMSDLILKIFFHKPRFTWGSENLINPSDCRTRYIDALKAADRNNFSLLKEFIRS